ncbi:hypothetical protein GCM10009765_15000 [Fodinicola feengrottensis]|uniref:Uncharacterized protein n=1 Tax=Fodinicola feengrottensis TaxID=435914 RepID=A0ABN2G799_9ACTN
MRGCGGPFSPSAPKGSTFPGPAAELGWVVAFGSPPPGQEMCRATPADGETGHLALLVMTLLSSVPCLSRFPSRFPGIARRVRDFCAPLDVECGLLYRTRPLACDSWD